MDKNISMGDYVVYSTKGICYVESIEKKRFDREVKDYFVFVPVFDKKSTYYVPVDFDSSRVHIRPALTVNEAKMLIDFALSADAAEWIANPNERKQAFDKIYKSGDRKEIIKIIKSLKTHEKKQKEIGKQLYATDDRLLKGCINLIVNELSYVLDRTQDDLKIELGY